MVNPNSHYQQIPGLVHPLNPSIQNATQGGSELSLLMSKKQLQKMKKKKKIFGPEWQAKKYMNRDKFRKHEESQDEDEVERYRRS